MSNEELHIPEEFEHFRKVLDMGAVKYGANSWLKGQHFDVHRNHRSMSHHLLESYREVREDAESGLDPLLHLATRALMEYTLRARGLIDVKTGKVDPGRAELAERGYAKDSIDTVIAGTTELRMTVSEEEANYLFRNRRANKWIEEINSPRFKHVHDWGFDIKRDGTKHSEK